MDANMASYPDDLVREHEQAVYAGLKRKRDATLIRACMEMVGSGLKWINAVGFTLAVSSLGQVIAGIYSFVYVGLPFWLLTTIVYNRPPYWLLAMIAQDSFTQYLLYLVIIRIFGIQLSFLCLTAIIIWRYLTFKTSIVLQLSCNVLIVLLIHRVCCPDFYRAPPDPCMLSYSVKANMHAIQLGVEQYAGDNYGNYPDGVLKDGFSWPTYVPSQPKNPLNQAITGSMNMEADVETTTEPTGGPIYSIAQTYTGTGKAGTMRYFSDTSNHSTYALIGYDRCGKPIKESAAEDANNYVLHN